MDNRYNANPYHGSGNLPHSYSVAGTGGGGGAAAAAAAGEYSFPQQATSYATSMNGLPSGQPQYRQQLYAPPPHPSHTHLPPAQPYPPHQYPSQLPSNAPYSPHQTTPSQYPSPRLLTQPMVVIPQAAQRPITHQQPYPVQYPHVPWTSPGVAYQSPPWVGQQQPLQSPTTAPQPTSHRQGSHMLPSKSSSHPHPPPQRQLPPTAYTQPQRQAPLSKPSPVLLQQPQAVPQVRRLQPIVEIESSAPKTRTLQQTPKPAPPSTTVDSHSLTPMPSSAPRGSMPLAKKPSEPVPKDPSIDYRLLLLSLAEECITAARGMSSLVALLQNEDDKEQYYQLMATAMGSMESILRNFRLAPREEALLTMRYSSLVLQETESDAVLETYLRKGIALAERNRMFDLKYTMQYLDIQTTFRSNPKAALKMVENVINHAVAFQHNPWVYAFRFLRVFLCSNMANDAHDDAIAVQDLKAVQQLAKRLEDDTIFVTAATFEAMVHLRSGSSECIDHAQRAMAAARTYQLKGSVQGSIDQIWALLDCIDLACSLFQCNAEQSGAKLEVVQKLLDKRLETSAAWSDDGSFSLPINLSYDMSITKETNGIFSRTERNQDMLNFKWLNKQDLYSLGYHMSGLATQLKSNSDKAQKYFQEGLKLLEGSERSQLSDSIESLPPDSLNATAERLHWRLVMRWKMRLHLAFAQCNLSHWADALQSLKLLERDLKYVHSSASRGLSRWTAYLTAVIAQGTGHLDAALQIYQSPTFPLPKQPTPMRLLSVEDELSLLAGLNSLLILRNPTHPSHHLAAPLLASLEAYTLKHRNKSLAAATYLLKAQDPSTDPEKDGMIIHRKQNLQHALNAARQMSNAQLLTIAMSFMNTMFFRGIIGAQANKSMNTAYSLSKRLGNPLWTLVASNMYIETMEKEGLSGEQYVQLKQSAEKAAAELDETVREAFAEKER